MLETLKANTIRMSIEYQHLDSSSTDFSNFEEVVVDNKVLKSVLDESTSSPTIVPAILD